VWCGKRLGALAYWLQPKRTQIGLLNLRAAFDGELHVAKARRIIRECYQNLGAGVAELLRLPVIDQAYIKRYVTIEGERHFEQAVASGKPVIFLSGHYGNWELSSVVAALKGHPITALARAQKSFPRLYRLLVSYRESKGCTIIHKGGAIRQLVAALGERGLVGIVGDQASRQGIFIDFFGRSALFATGPFELAYAKEALIVPAFIHRLRGPFHRLVVEPPIALDHQAPKPLAVRACMEQFARLLASHITDDPCQWLWMHKRWKHTAARRILVLGDGKAGHLKQSLAVVEAARDSRAEISHHVLEIRYRSRLHRLLALMWAFGSPGGVGAAMCLQHTLTLDSAAALLKRYADAIISCGASLAPCNLLWAAAQGAKSIVLMNPAPLPLGRFSLVIAPQHDRLPSRRNIVQIRGAMSRITDEMLRNAQRRLQTHPNFREGPVRSTRQPMMGVFIGGDTPTYELSAAFAETLISQVLDACESIDGECLVTTSRRTSLAVEEALTKRLMGARRCRLLIIANRDTLNGTMEGILGFADVALVTGESVSMVSEACASGRSVIVIEPPTRYGYRSSETKHHRFLHDLASEGYVRLVSVEALGQAIGCALNEHLPAKRLDSARKIREAIERLL
jgi:KDO2-lipid IV(A) lauroyltransferase